MGLVTFKSYVYRRKKEFKFMFVHLQYVLYRNIMSDSPMSGLGDLLCNYKSWMYCLAAWHRSVISGRGEKFWQFVYYFFLLLSFSVLPFVPFYNCPPGFLRKHFIKPSLLEENGVLASVSVICTKAGCSHKNWFSPLHRTRREQQLLPCGY